MTAFKELNRRLARQTIEKFSRNHPEIHMSLQAWSELISIVENAPKSLVSYVPMLDATKDDPLAQRTSGRGADWLASEVKVAFAGL